MTDAREVADVKTRLDESRRRRAAMVQRFGFMPMSVLRIPRGELDAKLFHLQKENGASTGQGERAKKRGGVYQTDRALRISGGGSRSRGSTWSIMSASLVEFFCKYYALPGQNYLDPFMGQGVQMQVAHLLGLNYYGYDCCKRFFAYIDGVREKITSPRATISINLGDSRFPSKIPDGIGDFSFHSPPYWDIEDYGDDPEQLGKGHTYEEFLQGMQDVARAWLPKFKKGAWHVVNVNDFKKDGRYYPYHSDLTTAFCRAGWAIVDTWIIEGTIAGLPRVFAEDFNSKRQAPKVHEYALVFRKP